MSGLLTSMGGAGAALALLVLGHVLADFALQTKRMVENKAQWRPLLAHGTVVTVTQTLVLAPMLTLRTAALVLAIGVSHVAIDALKTRLSDSPQTSLTAFVADQLAHLIVLLAAWRAIPPTAWTASPIVTALAGVPTDTWSQVTVGAIYLSAFVFAWHGGNAIVRSLLPEWDPETTEDHADLEAGATIGGLERLIVLGLGIAGQWEAVGLVLAAKSIARFEKLKQRPFAEYFLVGTLGSILVAILLALGVTTLT